MKLVFTLFATVAFPCLSLAEDGLVVGGGFNSSFTSQDGGGAEISNRPGFNLGVGYEFELAPSFVLLPELSLETRGEVYHLDASPFGAMDLRVKLLYLQVPVFLMFKAPVAVMTFNGFAGPALGILLSAKREVEAGGEVETTDMKDETESFDFGIEAGLGVEMPAGPGSVFVRPSYYLGLVKLADPEGDSDVFLRNIKLKAGFKIPI
jgi:hypothetical protein